jgi:membrane-associated protein
MLHSVLDIVLHLDTHLAAWGNAMGPWLYVLLFAIIFCETGLVVTPFLPGDSLLFAVGALAAVEGGPLSVGPIIILLIIAAILGDATNYAIGRRVGPRVFKSETSWFLNKKHLMRAQRFYERHGGKTIVFARFAPILRTFAPFVAGIGKMSYPRFAAFNVAGGIAWVVSFIVAGFWFGNLPAVKQNFHIVIIAIVVISFLPAVIEFLKERNRPPDDEVQPAS